MKLGSLFGKALSILNAASFTEKHSEKSSGIAHTSSKENTTFPKKIFTAKPKFKSTANLVTEKNAGKQFNRKFGMKNFTVANIFKKSTANISSPNDCFPNDIPSLPATINDQSVRQFTSAPNLYVPEEISNLPIQCKPRQSSEANLTQLKSIPLNLLNEIVQHDSIDKMSDFSVDSLELVSPEYLSNNENYAFSELNNNIFDFQNTSHILYHLISIDHNKDSEYFKKVAEDLKFHYIFNEFLIDPTKNDFISRAKLYCLEDCLAGLKSNLKLSIKEEIPEDCEDCVFEQSFNVNRLFLDLAVAMNWDTMAVIDTAENQAYFQTLLKKRSFSEMKKVFKYKLSTSKRMNNALQATMPDFSIESFAHLFEFWSNSPLCVDSMKEKIKQAINSSQLISMLNRNIKNFTDLNAHDKFSNVLNLISNLSTIKTNLLALNDIYGHFPAFPSFLQTVTQIIQHKEAEFRLENIAEIAMSACNMYLQGTLSTIPSLKAVALLQAIRSYSIFSNIDLKVRNIDVTKMSEFYDALKCAIDAIHECLASNSLVTDGNRKSTHLSLIEEEVEDLVSECTNSSSASNFPTSNSSAGDEEIKIDIGISITAAVYIKELKNSLAAITNQIIKDNSSIYNSTYRFLSAAFFNVLKKSLNGENVKRVIEEVLKHKI